MEPLKIEYDSPEEWLKVGEELFGKDKLKWQFVCPSCGYIASAQDWKDVGADEGEIGFSCVGRHKEKAQEMGSKKGGPCNYAGGGLFRLNPVKIKCGKEVHEYFQFAPNGGQG